LSQRLQLDWLERTASLQHSGASPAEIRNELDLLLKDKLSVGTTSKKQTNRRKAINNLMKIWVSVPPNLEPLKDFGEAELVQWCDDGANSLLGADDEDFDRLSVELGVAVKLEGKFKADLPCLHLS
jgi:hypothetical protein